MVAFYLPGGAPLYLYTLLLAFGVFIGLAGVAQRAPNEDALPLAEAGIWSLLAALVGSRIAYAWLAWPAFAAQPSQILQVWLGGLTWPGAVAGALLALPALARITRRSPGMLADALLPLLGAVSVAAWLGCIADGSGYGPPMAWGGMAFLDEWGRMALRWPVQPACALGCLALLWGVDRLPRRAASIPGLRASLALLGQAAVQLGAAALTVPTRLWGDLPWDAWAALALALLALAGLGTAVFSGRREESR